MKTAILAIAIIAGICISTNAEAAVPLCTAADDKSPPSDQDPANKREFTLAPLAYRATGQAPKDYGLDVNLVVDENGHVTCASLSTLDGIDTLQRKTLANAVAGWHYQPFLIDGKPSRVMIREHVDEELQPSRHVPMPKAPL